MITNQQKNFLFLVYKSTVNALFHCYSKRLQNIQLILSTIKINKDNKLNSNSKTTHNRIRNYNASLL